MLHIFFNMPIKSTTGFLTLLKLCKTKRQMFTFTSRHVFVRLQASVGRLPAASSGIFNGLILSSLHSMHPRYQEHIQALSCVLCTWVLEYWN